MVKSYHVLPWSSHFYLSAINPRTVDTATAFNEYRFTAFCLLCT